MSAETKEWKQLRNDPDLLIQILEKGKPAVPNNDDDDEQDKEGPKKIQSGDTILLDLEGRMATSKDDLEGPIFQSTKGWLVTIGEPHCLLRCIEYAIEEAMHEGEIAHVYCSNSFKYHYSGCNSNDDPYRQYKDTKLPASSNVVYKISATKIVIDTSRLNPYFTIQRAMTMKNIANDIYQYEWNIGGSARERSVKLYEKAARIMKTLLGGTYFNSVEENHPQRQECQTLLVDSLNNVIAVYMRAKRYKKAREAASAVFAEDSKNTKALFRNAKSAMLDPELSLAEKDAALTKAENIIVYKDKEEADLRKLRAQWNKKKNKEEQQQ